MIICVMPETSRRLFSTKTTTATEFKWSSQEKWRSHWLRLWKEEHKDSLHCISNLNVTAVNGCFGWVKIVLKTQESGVGITTRVSWQDKNTRGIWVVKVNAVYTLCCTTKLVGLHEWGAWGIFSELERKRVLFDNGNRVTNNGSSSFYWL